MEIPYQQTWDKFRALTGTILEAFKLQKSFSAHDLTLFALASKIENNGYAIKMLLDSNLIQDSKVILRSMGEATLILFSALHDGNFAERFKAEELRRKTKLWNSIEALTKDRETDEYKAQLEKVKAMREERKSIGFNDYDKEAIAKNHNLEFVFYVVENMNHSEVHSTPDVLGSYVETDEDKKSIVKFIGYPDIQDKPFVFFQMIACIYSSFFEFSEKYTIAQKEILEASFKEFGALYNES